MIMPTTKTVRPISAETYMPFMSRYEEDVTR
jgi:hypothetical protein